MWHFIIIMVTRGITLRLISTYTSHLHVVSLRPKKWFTCCWQVCQQQVNRRLVACGVWTSSAAPPADTVKRHAVSIRLSAWVYHRSKNASHKTEVYSACIRRETLNNSFTAVVSSDGFRIRAPMPTPEKFPFPRGFDCPLLLAKLVAQPKFRPEQSLV